jgi:2-keto-3-deoxy-L-rhamnonate aldolase RhmA
MSIIRNSVKHRMAAGEVTLGFGVYHLRTAATAAIAAACGHDWLFLDMEHGAFSVQEVTQICLAALPTGITPIVRVCNGAIDEGSRALDNGAMGIVVPHVDTAEEAHRVARAYRYPPLGTRSWGGPPALFGYQPPGNAAAQQATNAEILVVAMIESPEAVVNAGGIAAVDGIDVLLIGASDLSAEMGISGEVLHPRMVAAFQAVADACKEASKVMGMGGVYDEAGASRYMAMGARFILTGSDHAFMLSAGAARAAFLRRQAAAP